MLHFFYYLQRYFHKYNTSLNGLMIHHNIKPKEFLKYVHDIDLSFMKKDLILREELKNLKLKSRDFSRSLFVSQDAKEGDTITKNNIKS